MSIEFGGDVDSVVFWGLEISVSWAGLRLRDCLRWNCFGRTGEVSLKDLLDPTLNEGMVGCSRFAAVREVFLVSNSVFAFKPF